MNRRKNFIVSKRHLQVDYLDWRLVTTRMHFWFVPQPSMKQDKKPFLRFYNSVFYVTPIIQHCWGAMVKDTSTIQCDANNICQILQNDIYKTVSNCCKCVWHMPSERLRRPLQLFHASVPLELIAIHLLGPPLKTLAATNPYESWWIIIQS